MKAVIVGKIGWYLVDYDDHKINIIQQAKLNIELCQSWLLQW